MIHQIKKHVSSNEFIYLLIGVLLFAIAVFLARASLIPVITFYFKAGNYLALIFFLAISTGAVMVLSHLIKWFLHAEGK